jgi:antitoxin component HigA of HigAB toxin-antitoxin module
MGRAPANATELKIKISKPLIISLFQMASDGLVPPTAKGVENFVSMMVESAVADYRLQQHQKKTLEIKQHKYLKPGAIDASFNHRRKIAPETTQRILYAHQSLGLTLTELGERFGISRTQISNILAAHANAQHTQIRGNNKRGAGSQRQQS